LVVENIDLLPQSLQPRLDDAIETGVVVSDNGGPGRIVRTRLIAIGGHNLEAAVDRGEFHAGLYYRLASLTIRVPALRERTVDIPRIAQAMLAQIAGDAGRTSLQLSDTAIRQLVRHTWPGNLRELRAVLTRAALLCEGDVIGPEELARVAGASWPARATAGAAGTPSARVPGTRRSGSPQVPRVSVVAEVNLDDAARAERERIEMALQATGGHRERAANLLGMSRTTLWTRMCVLGIDPDRYRRSRSD
jgi:DNA-binding NtrC family response regulator